MSENYLESLPNGLSKEAKLVFSSAVCKAQKEGCGKASAFAQGYMQLKKQGFRKDAKTGVWERPVAQTMKLKMMKVTKAEEDKRLVFGFFSVVEVGDMPVVDLQGDVIAAKDIEDAAYRYMQFSRMGDDRHDERCKAVLIESMVFTKEKQQALGIDLGMVGWWGGFKVLDDSLWENFKSGKYEGFSIGGRGHRERFDV